MKLLPFLNWKHNVLSIHCSVLHYHIILKCMTDWHITENVKLFHTSMLSLCSRIIVPSNKMRTPVDGIAILLHLKIYIYTYTLNRIKDLLYLFINMPIHHMV